MFVSESTPESSTSLPDGWESVDPTGAPYRKLISRDAVDVRDHRGNPRYRRDVVVLVNLTNDRVGVAKGPAHRNSWPVEDPDAAGRRVAREIQQWLDDGNGPYDTNGDLEQRLERVATEGHR